MPLAVFDNRALTYSIAPFRLRCWLGVPQAERTQTPGGAAAVPFPRARSHAESEIERMKRLLAVIGDRTEEASDTRRPTPEHAPVMS
jgi:hypothetical protein